MWRLNEIGSVALQSETEPKMRNNSSFERVMADLWSSNGTEVFLLMATHIRGPRVGQGKQKSTTLQLPHDSLALESDLFNSFEVEYLA